MFNLIFLFEYLVLMFLFLLFLLFLIYPPVLAWYAHTDHLNTLIDFLAEGWWKACKKNNIKVNMTFLHAKNLLAGG